MTAETAAPGPKPRSGSKLRFFVILLLLAAPALHLLRPDLAPWDGRLFITVSWHRTGDLKPGATVLVEGKETIGKVQSIQLGEQGEPSLVHLEITSEGKKFCCPDSRFRIAAPNFGFSATQVWLELGDPKSSRLTHKARVEGTEGFAGSLEKLGKALKEAAKDLGEAAKDPMGEKK